MNVEDCRSCWRVGIGGGLTARLWVVREFLLLFAYQGCVMYKKLNFYAIPELLVRGKKLTFKLIDIIALYIEINE